MLCWKTTGAAARPTGRNGRRRSTNEPPLKLAQTQQQRPLNREIGFLFAASDDGLQFAVPWTQPMNGTAANPCGKQVAVYKLLPLVYDELRQLAAQRLAKE